MQHEYITSPTNHDFHTQLENLNNQIDGITPPLGISSRRETKNGSSTKSLPGTIFKSDCINSLIGNGSASKLLPVAVPSNSYHNPMSTSTPTSTAKKLYFFKQQPPKRSLSSDHPKKQGCPAIKEVEADKNPVDRPTNTAPSQPQKQDTTVTLDSTKKLAVIQKHVHAPHIDRLEQIASTRGKLHVLTDPIDLTSPRNASKDVSDAPENDSNGAETRSLSCSRSSVSVAKAPAMNLVGRNLFPVRPSFRFDVAFRLIHSPPFSCVHLSFRSRLPSPLPSWSPTRPRRRRGNAIFSNRRGTTGR